MRPRKTHSGDELTRREPVGEARSQGLEQDNGRNRAKEGDEERKRIAQRPDQARLLQLAKAEHRGRQDQAVGEDHERSEEDKWQQLSLGQQDDHMLGVETKAAAEIEHLYARVADEAPADTTRRRSQ
jgi:hypothetical protein